MYSLDVPGVERVISRCSGGGGVDQLDSINPKSPFSFRFSLFTDIIHPGTIDGANNKWLRAFPCYSPKTPAKIFEHLFFYFSDIQPTNFANVEDMLFEVFRCEETDTINNIAIAQFLKVVIELVCKNSKLLFHSYKFHLPFHFLPCFFSFQENLHYAQDVLCILARIDF